MSAYHNLTTVLQMAFAPIWKDHFNVHVHQVLQEMGKTVMVG